MILVVIIEAIVIHVNSSLLIYINVYTVCSHWNSRRKDGREFSVGRRAVLPKEQYAKQAHQLEYTVPICKRMRANGQSNFGCNMLAF